MTIFIVCFSPKAYITGEGLDSGMDPGVLSQMGRLFKRGTTLEALERTSRSLSHRFLFVKQLSVNWLSLNDTCS